MNKIKAGREKRYRHSEQKANTERQRKTEERRRDGESPTNIYPENSVFMLVLKEILLLGAQVT